ncbi:MAG TPA: heme-binding beta-barrel domain-containing protein [Turneriella sp.]|nr:heme-binding beta-barrel domain-containing protein [Turneriella sp.]
MEEQDILKVFFGPLFPLIGTWTGDKGMDISPEPEGEEHSPYFETITIEPVGDAVNAEEQKLVVLSYKQVVCRKSNGEVFHHQLGYWYYEKKTNEIFYSLSIPRAVSVLAKGNAQTKGNQVDFFVEAKKEDPNFGVLETPFMSAKASTRGFTLKVNVDGDTMRYTMNTALSIYDRSFDHTDENTLTRKK